MKRFALILAAVISLAACSPRAYRASAGDEIVILYDNDVHCNVDGYVAMAALKAAYSEECSNVCCVSSGDFVQGGTLGAASKGGYIVSLMNTVGYDVVTLGNHEFDYGMARLGELSSSLNAEIVDCNLYDLRSGEAARMYEPYSIRTFGRTKVAFVGISTPYSFVSSTPSYFQNEAGEYVYSLSSDDFYEVVQGAVDQARGEGADYVVALTHLGDDTALDEINSLALAESTSGIDVILDGHSHSTVPCLWLTNKAGEDIIMTSTGSGFRNIGVLRIAPARRLAGKTTASANCATELIATSDIAPEGDAAAKVSAVVAEVRREYEAYAGRCVGSCEAFLAVADEGSPRAVRYREMGIGNFCTDAIRTRMGSQIAVLGGGSIRAALPAGPISFNDIFAVFPFGNTIATATLTGQQILDMLEFSANSVPVEFGGFLQVSGLRLTIDKSVPSPVVVDDKKMFLRFDGTQRRVSDVSLENPDGTLEPLDPAGTYSVAGSAYLLKEHGDGYSLLSGAPVVDTGVLDVQLLEDFIGEDLGGVIPARYSAPASRITLR